ncbi:hypothetical protein [Aristaeella hokkaidonensis]|uniref:Uncharacterized protein n=1 Tax=Aristaeella hokkaidonensis TaxID=3046382 RepID=A0AC61N212_9FIRM|nr:hypothetical protein [Aristaeella hokkaidonensis]QUC66375.1 hypothetical protein JYE49_10960 [Aristaeella hokkaidonensis]SNT94214.1 hypothetical protein SAMN06297421_104186 [Aristaeella hokkaidonensis]
MNKIKGMISILLIVMILFAGVSIADASSMEKEELYNATIHQLESWLQTPGRPAAELEQIIASFDSLQSYKMSKGFNYFTNVLLKAIQGSFDFDYKFWINMLEQNESFQEYIHNDINSLSILSVPEMLNYVKGREAEQNGDITAAITFYANSINFYDASDRYKSLAMGEYASKYAKARELMNNNELVSAYRLFAEINGYDDSIQRMDYIVQVLGYDPAQETPVPTEVPTPEAMEVVISTPTEAPDTIELIPVLSQSYPGISAKLKTHEGRWFSKYGPGNNYAKGASAGGFKTDSKHSNRLTVYFVENGWVYADIVYSTAFERYAYLPQNAVNVSDSIPQISALESFEGVTTQIITPLWGPNDSFNRNQDCTINANTTITAFFRENDYVFAEFSCAQGTVRMWLPISDILFK